MTRPALFVTGAARSGTTLLEKFLCSHPRLSVLSQPLPLLFVETKQAFLTARAAGDDRYPLGTLFGETLYRRADFSSYLDGWRGQREELVDLAQRMENFSGQYTRLDRARWAGSLADLQLGFAPNLRHWYRAFGHREDADSWGGKESFCEEYLPHLLDHGFACLFVIRDPRAVVASLSHGHGRTYAGRLKPVLWNVRQWRRAS